VEGRREKEIELRGANDTPSGLIRTEFRPTADGMLARVEVDPPTGMKSLALYRHPADITLPTPANATIADLEWLTGACVGTRGSSTTEER
jgi:hypothetical protein